METAEMVRNLTCRRNAGAACEKHDCRFHNMNAHETAFPASAFSNRRPVQSIEVDRSRWV